MISIMIGCDWYYYWLLLNKFHVNVVHYILYDITFSTKVICKLLSMTLVIDAI